MSMWSAKNDLILQQKGNLDCLHPWRIKLEGDINFVSKATLNDNKVIFWNFGDAMDEFNPKLFEDNLFIQNSFQNKNIINRIKGRNNPSKIEEIGQLN